MRVEKHRGQSLHYFHFCAIQNRIDFSDFPDIFPATCLNSPKRRALHLLPSVEDDNDLRANMAVLVSRIIVDNIPFFHHTFDGIVTRHIKHKYYSEMCQTSVVVSMQKCSII